MKNYYLQKDYSNFTSEDFLQDDFFVSSMKNPNEKSVEFWDGLLNAGSINKEEFYSAKSFIEAIEANYKDSVQEEELSALWTKIDNTNKKSGKIKFKSILSIAGGIAAGIIFVIIAIPHLTRNFQSPNDDIMSYARDNNIKEDDNTDIQIILSNQKTLQLTEQESDIVYDSTEIKISKKGISKKESAAYNQLIVPKGKRSKLTLADGTMMYVNSGTRVVYPIEFVDDRREIYVDGEIYITVTHDEKRPFIVKTKDIDVQVFGTSFNVMAYESDLNKQVTLVQGSVRISNKAKEIMLKPSQMYEMDNGQVSVNTVDASRYTSWINGMYLFNSERLEIVLSRLSRYYGEDITFSKDVANLRCTGKMDLKDDLKDILHGLAFSFPIHVQHDNNKYNITKN
ncbi:MAG: FecR domain-containing protein [Prevotella sp.]|jgi:hypothetical protein|nr:FecR domain-containing protein [Prevotella sp.]